jgi:hypothetical protein
MATTIEQREIRTAWDNLWAAEKAVAEAYGLCAEDFRHILTQFPVFARKRPDFYTFLVEKASAWSG